MAATAGKMLSSDKIFIKSSQDFEFYVGDRLKWNRNKWIEQGESGSKINKLCNSANYWKYKLKAAFEETGIIITFFNENKDVSIGLADIVDAIEGLKLNVSIVGFTGFRNPRYMGVYFKNKEERDLVMLNFRMVEDSFVFYLSWALEAQDATRFLKVHWLPITLDIKVIEAELNKYVNCIENERQSITLMSGRDFVVGKVTFKVNVKKDVKIEDVPHVIIIKGLEALITINGRQPLCLNCDRLGHISKDCNYRFCNVCRSMKVKEHVCKDCKDGVMYADKVKTGLVSNQPDDWGDAIFINKNGGNEEAAGILQSKIVSIENQLSQLVREDDSSYLKRIELKRKSLGNGNLLNQQVDEESWGGQESVCSEESLMEEGNLIDSDENSDGALKNANPKKEANAEQDSIVANKKKKNKKPKNTTQSSARKITGESNKQFVKEESDCVLRSYGKPNYGNARRRNEDKVFKKAQEKCPDNREFVFTD